MAIETTSYGRSVTVGLPYDDAVEAVRKSLAEEGFGVLTEIDVAATLHKKLGVDFRRYVILGACNPTLAHRALTAELDIGLLLPCNVIVYETDDGGSVVAALDPGPMVDLTRNAEIEPVAREARGRLDAALNRLEES